MKTDEDWVLLAYRLPSVPSPPRSQVWRKLKRLGVAQLGDGLVALPADARTTEALEWIAEYGRFWEQSFDSLERLLDQQSKQSRRGR